MATTVSAPAVERRSATAVHPVRGVGTRTLAGSPALAIETRDLTKQYGPVKAVDSLSLGVRQGEIYGFLGPNGAGKTTTLRMLLGLIEPTGGEISLMGSASGS
ncbi:MAG: ATP-binding cassette domain-containing protein, partial [Chloroflexota bacterium]|nr:ATP-binding cassette domain-containing protein [Chloroflexota bacterium]